MPAEKICYIAIDSMMSDYDGTWYLLEDQHGLPITLLSFRSREEAAEWATSHGWTLG